MYLRKYLPGSFFPSIRTAAVVVRVIFLCHTISMYGILSVLCVLVTNIPQFTLYKIPHKGIIGHFSGNTRVIKSQPSYLYLGNFIIIKMGLISICHLCTSWAHKTAILSQSLGPSQNEFP